MSERPTPETDTYWQNDEYEALRDDHKISRWSDFARKLERERDEARAVANALADIAFKHLTSLLASTPHSRDAAHDAETQQVIADIKRWKEMKK